MPSIDRATALAARSSIQALGVEITRSYRYSSAVAAVIPPDLAPQLRRLAVVDYVEAAFPGRLTQATPPQDTSWGVKRVSAHWVWSGSYGPSTRGEWAFVTMLDGGVDSIHRWSASGDGPENLNLDCYWVEGSGSSCYDDHPILTSRGHGAHVAGIIAGRNNEYGYIGIAHNLHRFASIKVCSQSDCDPDWVASGLDWVLDQNHPRRIVNMSLGFCYDYTPISQIVASLASVGVLMIASAGKQYPGFSVQQVCPDGHDLGAEWSTGEYNDVCGTSMSAPVVAGVAALVWSHNPSWTATQVRGRLTSTALPYAPATHFGAGRVNAPQAVYGPPPPTYSATITGPAEVLPYATCSFTATTNSPDAPYAYEWFVDDSPVGSYGSSYYHTAGTAAFTLSVTIVDSQNRELHGVKSVSVNPSAPECLDT